MLCSTCMYDEHLNTHARSSYYCACVTMYCKCAYKPNVLFWLAWAMNWKARHGG